MTCNQAKVTILVKVYSKEQVSILNSVIYIVDINYEFNSKKKTFDNFKVIYLEEFK